MPNIICNQPGPIIVRISHIEAYKGQGSGYMFATISAHTFKLSSSFVVQRLEVFRDLWVQGVGFSRVCPKPETRNPEP